MAIKDSAESWVRSKPMLATGIIALAGIVIGGVIGLGVGYKIEQKRTRSDVQALQKKLKAKGVVNPEAPLHVRVGTVSSASPGTLVLKTTRQGGQQIHVTATTPFEKTAAAATADIAVGRRVLVSKGAHEVIILSSTSSLGRVVGNVGSDTFSVTNAAGKQVKVKLANVQKVYKLVAAKGSDAKTGALVLAGGRGAGTNGFAAVEIIVLPAGSAFSGA